MAHAASCGERRWRNGAAGESTPRRAEVQRELAPAPLDQLGILGDNFGGEGTGVIYLDTVSLGDLLVPVRTCTWGAVKALYR